MQDRYVGDIGDFGKFGILKAITEQGLSLGVNWYRVGTTEKELVSNNDGKHTSYLNGSNDSFRKCDSDLYESLRLIVNENRRNISDLEKLNLLSNTTYYNDLLGKEYRKYWFAKSLAVLHNCEVVFLDPDNGLKIKSISETSSKSVKYLFREELAQYFQDNKQSVVFYNHRCRKKEAEYLKRFSELKNDVAFSGARWTGLKFIKGTIRDYFFIMQPGHVQAIERSVDYLLNSNWNHLFSPLSF